MDASARSSSGRSSESDRQMRRWSVRRIRARRTSHDGNSHSCLQFARLLEREGSQQPQLAAQGYILPGPATRQSTKGPKLPSTPPASFQFEESFVPDSPEEVWPASRKVEELFVPDSPEKVSSGAKDYARRGSCKLTRPPPASLPRKLEELVVPDSPEDTWSASPYKLPRTTLTSTNFEDPVILELPSETGVASHRPSKLRRTTSSQAAEQIAVDSNENLTFKTGYGRTFAISRRAIEKAKAVLAIGRETAASLRKSINPHSRNLANPTKLRSPSHMSRKTPSIRKFTISSEAVSRARALLSPVGAIEDPLAITALVTGSGKSGSVASNALEKVVRAYSREDARQTAPIVKFDSVVNTSFVTGTGKSVIISSKALERARAVLREDFEDTAPEKGLDDPAAITSSVAGWGESVSFSCRRFENARVVSGEDPEDTAPVEITSFVTGSGRSVSVTIKSLEKARAVLGEDFEEAALVKGTDEPVAFTSFVTVSGKSVSISSKALQKARAFSREEFEETALCISHDRELESRGPLLEAKFGQPSVITDESSIQLNLHKPDADGFLSATLPSAAGEGYQWRNVRAFKPPRVQKLSDRTGIKMNISASIFGSNSCNSVPLADDHRQLQPLRPAYLNDDRRGRMRLREYLEGTRANEGFSLCPELGRLTSDAADSYRIHHVTEDGRRQSIGSTEIWKLLLDLGADPLYSSKEWVANHYKWIIWKLASSERKHPRQAARKRLALDTVLEELKYRYDTELSGCRSAIRRITEGDSSASRAMVVLVSAIRHDGGENEAFKEFTGNTSSSGDTAKIEVTDGWYRLNAVLDIPLTKYLRRGKLNKGQKIQVCGATLCCCPDSTSPLEAFRKSFLTLHANGTYRVRQNHRLGFCREPVPPLAFRCIVPDGGLVPKTYVGVARVYPILFKETFADGRSIVRSVRAEELASDQFEQRRAKVAEEAMLTLGKSCEPSKSQEEKDEEGFELFNALEKAAEPDVLMAEMTPVQLKSLATYQARREISKQVNIEDAVKEALQDAGLHSRNVTRILKVRGIGLQRRGEENEQVGRQRKEGVISIWEISDEQQIVEGSVYCVSGLRPVTWSSYRNQNQLQLQSYCSTSWRHVPDAIYKKHFWFPYACRAPTRLSDMDENSVYREFDVAAKILVVDEPYSSGSRTHQWVFVTDGSTTRNNPGDAWDEIQILAVKVSLPALAFAEVDRSLVGSVVGFCNLVQQPKDHNCHWWVAEASDLSLFSSTLATHPAKHLQTAAKCVLEWDKASPWASDSLRNLIQAMMSQGAQWYSF